MEKVVNTFTLEQLPQIVADLKNEIQEMKALILLKAEKQTKPDKPLNIKDVAKFTGLTVSTLYGYCQRSEMPYSKKGNRLFFFEAELIEWIKSGKQKTLKELEADAQGYLSKRKSNQLKLF